MAQALTTAKKLPHPHKMYFFGGWNKLFMKRSFEVSASVLAETQYRWSWGLPKSNCHEKILKNSMVKLTLFW
jgi:hypothetical protein